MNHFAFIDSSVEFLIRPVIIALKIRDLYRTAIHVTLRRNPCEFIRYCHLIDDKIHVLASGRIMRCAAFSTDILCGYQLHDSQSCCILKI